MIGLINAAEIIQNNRRVAYRDYEDQQARQEQNKLKKVICLLALLKAQSCHC